MNTHTAFPSPSPAPSAAPSPAARLALLCRFLVTDPDNQALRKEVFHAALAEGNATLAREQIEWSRPRCAADPAWRHNTALLAMQQGDWEDARSLLQALVTDAPAHGQNSQGSQDTTTLSYHLAYTHHALGDHAGALERIAALRPGSSGSLPQAFSLQLRALHQLHRLDEAWQAIGKADPSCWTADALGAASLLALDLEKFEVAGELASRALARDPTQWEACVAQGTLLVEQEQPDAALQMLLPATQRHDQDGRSWSATGLAHMLAGRLDLAHQALTRAVALMPQHIGTRLALAWTEIAQGRLPAAEAAFAAAISLDRNFAESHGGLAAAQALQGKVTEAQASIRLAQGLDPQGPSALYAQAVLSGEMRDPVRLRELARRVMGQQTNRRHDDSSSDDSEEGQT
ncbi:tetratricopeptide repeat protein [Xylophilus rhododendri]|uniref:Tetratricopeptide repeat protein n=1 Tax=Xylophilus rhododendri TaxID=2697032 RepID=A0A857J589_9BURK|nr:tetratricopeptide repeat protein [Xylophilus rhododendri]QHI99154.1 tetratricopeptide repeat protein [Xylophilus rhododendri]